jgi:hypothetical protein
MLERFYQFFTSLKLTFVLLCLSAVLVFLGTMAQDPLGLYLVQERFFKSFFVDATSMTAAIKKTLEMAHLYLAPTTASDVMAAPRIPVFPGGYLLGVLLVVNLACAHLRYYRTGWRKTGIVLIHSGILVMLLGQFATDVFQVESHLRISEGETKNYSESSRINELAILDTTALDHDAVVAFPERRIAHPAELRHPSLPFTVRVRTYHRNATPQFAPKAPPGEGATQGLGPRLSFEGRPPVTQLNARDVPAALVEIFDGSTSLGRWWVSNWLIEESLLQMLRPEAGAAVRPLLGAPQTFRFKDRTYQLALRPARYYKPFSLQLLKFSHDKYSGTEIPKNFSSRVRVLRPEIGEDREVLIYMNNPLRYAGETFYQSGYDENDARVTILQVVRNPGWLTPYLACVLVAVGMSFQFLLHLVTHLKERRTA